MLKTTMTISCFMFLVLLAIFPSGQNVAGRPPTDEDPKLTAGWWNIADADFVTQYGSLATGTQVQQSQFAWMLFARVNQQVVYAPDQKKYSQWELWPSDPDTFNANVARFIAANKIRPRPHLERLQQAIISPHVRLPATNPIPPLGEEVTRNMLSYNYIANNHFNTQAGLAAFFNKQGSKIDFPLGAVETKAFWTQGAIAGAYQEAGLSLTGLHLMVKVKPTPASPFTDDTPSWFWTTFELKSNTGLAAAQKFITYGDVLPPGQAGMLLTQAGLGGTPFANYVSNGQQTQFFDAKNKTIILGNTQMEWFFATPENQEPTTWQSWSSSCHSCHAQASGKVNGNSVNFFFFTAPVGALIGSALPSADYHSYDFNWALSKAK